MTGAQPSRLDRVDGWTRPAVRELKPYYKAPLEGDPLRLDQNTNLYGPNPVIRDFDPTDWPVDQYPSRDSDHLLDALARRHGLEPDHFVVGNGSDEILDLLTKCFIAPGQTLAVPDPSYSLYPFYAKLQDLRLASIPLRSGWKLDVEALLAAKPHMVMIASPNNPTGNRFPASDLEGLLEGTDGVVVIDEAYIEYAGEDRSMIRYVDAFDNLVVTRTFSKAYGLAGLRVGYLAANQHLIERLRLVKPPFNLNVWSEQVAVAALERSDWMEQVVVETQSERQRLEAALKDAGMRPFASDANFILAQTTLAPAQVAGALRQAGILVRTFPASPHLQDCVRFGVGRPEHTDRLLEALEEVVA